jgi:ubiquinone/menaquinone biosynthesis C-methylase UbiE
MDQRNLSARQFGDTAANYLSSAVHATGADLDALTELTRQLGPRRALDLGCGAGHVAFALARAGAADVVAYDFSDRMLAVVKREASARAHEGITIAQGPAEKLPFADTNFQLVVSRFSAHHWSSVPSALAEVARVLTPNGTLLIIDALAPESPLLDTTLQSLELLRDMSHVRNYRLSEWRAMLHESCLVERNHRAWKLSLEFQSWVQRIATPPRRIQALHALIDDMPSEARDYFAVTADRSFRIDAGWIEAGKRA